MSSKKIVINSDAQSGDSLDTFFTTLIAAIEADHFLMKQNIASDDTKKMYQDMMLGNELELAKRARESSSRTFIINLVTDYLFEVSQFLEKPKQLFMGLSDSKINVWAVVGNEDEITEDNLLLAEARVNSKYYDHGFYISSTLVEESDKIQPPSYFKSIKY